ncbi:hypothetical protein BK133_09065 [Paenibacillus sp. FSL H8-0548]|uniref:hypothetical protein n=1 Tax=Paenibacillus sp. FSL H8-0548 TaxID=1920422 RepID=UPI00096C90B5|nr:hypothetical protein [Paenibacillus sp. FSL H8-0548]OMF36782.1 hypothetical protein BK133_09065 [Paenibacillus sp. FSL H8-0548]
MTFKSIDLQMSIPRTQEFSGMHGQAIHKPVADQNKLAEQASKQTELLRGKNAAVEQSSGIQIRNEQDGQQEQPHQKSRRTKEESEGLESEKDLPPTHPYKGHKFDIKL